MSNQTQARVNLPEVLAILGSNIHDIAYDDAWDTHRQLNPSYRACLPLLREGLRDKNPDVRAYCLMAMEKIGVDRPDVIPEIAALLKDKNDDVRFKAAKALAVVGQQNKQAAVTALVNFCKDLNHIEFIVGPRVFWSLAKLVGGCGKALKLLLSKR